MRDSDGRGGRCARCASIMALRKRFRALRASLNCQINRVTNQATIYAQTAYLAIKPLLNGSAITSARARACWRHSSLARTPKHTRARDSHVTPRDARVSVCLISGDIFSDFLRVLPGRRWSWSGLRSRGAREIQISGARLGFARYLHFWGYNYSRVNFWQFV